MIDVRLTAAPEDWEAAKAIRFAVFVDEQQVPAEIELDAHDQTARHWLALVDGRPVGTARAVELGLAWKVGRVAVLKSQRGLGVGKVLMRAITAEARHQRVSELVLESQTHAIPFYEGLGYVPDGEVFMEAGIPHRKMRLRLAP